MRTVAILAAEAIEPCDGVKIWIIKTTDSPSKEGSLLRKWGPTKVCKALSAEK